MKKDGKMGEGRSFFDLGELSLMVALSEAVVYLLKKFVFSQNGIVSCSYRLLNAFPVHLCSLNLMMQRTIEVQLLRFLSSVNIQSRRFATLAIFGFSNSQFS